MIYGTRFHMPGTRCRNTDAGYTLLELLVVLAVIALVFSLGVPAFNGPGAGMKVARAETILVSILNEARTKAIAENHRVLVTVDVSTGSVRVDAGPPENFGSGTLGLELTTGRSLIEGSEGSLIFFPDGSSSGGRIRIFESTAARVVEVDWISGRVRAIADTDDGGGNDV